MAILWGLIRFLKLYTLDPIFEMLSSFSSIELKFSLTIFNISLDLITGLSFSIIGSWWIPAWSFLLLFYIRLPFDSYSSGSSNIGFLELSNSIICLKLSISIIEYCYYLSSSKFSSIITFLREFLLLWGSIILGSFFNSFIGLFS